MQTHKLHITQIVHTLYILQQVSCKNGSLVKYNINLNKGQYYVFRLLPLTAVTFSLCLTHLHLPRLLQVMLSPHRYSKEEALRIAGARFFADWMPFLSPNQQCQITEGTVLILC